MPEQTRQHRRRNPVAVAEILRKGGVHENSRKSKRQKQKRELRKTVSKAMATYRGHSFVWVSILLNYTRIIYALNKQYCRIPLLYKD
jgi:hypothetical protein